MDNEDALQPPPVAENADGPEPAVDEAGSAPPEPAPGNGEAASEPGEETLLTMPEETLEAETTPEPEPEPEPPPVVEAPVVVTGPAASGLPVVEPSSSAAAMAVAAAVTSGALLAASRKEPLPAPVAQPVPEPLPPQVAPEPEAEPEPTVAPPAAENEVETSAPSEPAPDSVEAPAPSAVKPPAPGLPLTPPKLALAVRDLEKRFGANRVLNGLSFQVGEGEIYGFLGKNGAGKTTTIRTLMGIIRPDRGYFEIFGKRTRRPGIAQKRLIGYVSQDQHFYPWMTCEDLGAFASGFYPTWDKQEFSRLLGVLDLPPARRFSQLSGGMKLKLALAMALAYRPPLLILDEPTAGLDPVARREFLDIIESQARNYGRTTFFSTHRIDEVERLADRVGIVNDGRMFYEGTVPALKESVRKVVVSLTVPKPAPPVEAASPATPLEGGVEYGGESQGAAAIPGLFSPPPVPKAPVVIGEPFRLLREERYGGEWVRYYWAPPEAWAAHPFPPEASVREIGLEEIVLAFVGSQRVEL